jgi:hypothetical protein
MCERFSIKALGAITSFADIRSGGLVFNDKRLLTDFELKYDGLHYILSIYSKNSSFDYSLGGYSHREH